MRNSGDHLSSLLVLPAEARCGGVGGLLASLCTTLLRVNPDAVAELLRRAGGLPDGAYEGFFTVFGSGGLYHHGPSRRAPRRQRRASSFRHAYGVIWGRDWHRCSHFRRCHTRVAGAKTRGHA